MKKSIVDQEIKINVSGEEFVLHSKKVIYWHSADILFLSDPHFGKVAHFRKGGIPVPNQLLEGNYHRLEESIRYFNAENVVILGDLFHSDQNLEWELLKDFVLSFESVQFKLVLGNHDILSKNEFSDSKFEIFYEPLVIAPFILTHYPMEKADDQYYNLAGHVHPGVRLKGGPAQSVRLPCFYFNRFQGILPAFGNFTGNFKLKPKSGDRIIAIADEQLIFFE